MQGSMCKFALLAGLAMALGQTAVAQVQEEARANALWDAGKKLDAEPLYEELTKLRPNESIYFQRLAGCILAQIEELSIDPKGNASQIKALTIRERDAARRAVQLGDTSNVTQMMASVDPDAPQVSVADIGGPAHALIGDAERAFAAGDFKTAMEKYAAAADADPTLYEAPLYAGDTAYSEKDLNTAAKWFARAIQVNRDRETAYRYWGDAILRYGSDPAGAKEKYIQAIVAEPYSRLAWQGIQQWARIEKAVLLAPKIVRPSGPVPDPKKPNNLTINIDAATTDDVKNPGGSAWVAYSISRAAFQSATFSKDFPAEKSYRHTLKEESEALSDVVSVLKERKIDRNQLDESLRNLLDLSDAGMLDCWILINGADQGVAQDYDSYRKDHRQLLHDYLAKFVIHGGSI
jgi:tetratricopeptide (TPR) repeat protein